MNCLQSITRSSIQLVALCSLLQFALAGHVFAICNPAGLELKVNTHIEKGQRDSALAALTKGRFVVTWASFGQDGSDDGIYGQLIDDLGNKVGSEFPVNTYTNSGQYDPSIAGLPEGGFVVTWTSYGQDGSGDGIYGQVFDSAGNKVGSEFPVNTYTTNNQGSSSVAALMAGGFVVAWQSAGQNGNGWGIYSQLFDGAGNKVGREFLVNSYRTTSQTAPSVAGLSGGGFVVTWRSDGEKDSDWGIDGQIFDSSGNKVGNQFRVNTYITWFEGNGSVVGLTGGGFVATWASYRWDGSEYNVYGQVFDSTGSKVGSEFQVNTYTASEQTFVSVVGLLGGAFVVTWASFGQDGSGYGVYGQVFSNSGNKLGSEFRVNTYTTGSQEGPSIAGLSGGRFVSFGNQMVRMEVTLASMPRDFPAGADSAKVN